jgi:hypothetical protein
MGNRVVWAPADWQPAASPVSNSTIEGNRFIAGILAFLPFDICQRSVEHFALCVS